MLDSPSASPRDEEPSCGIAIVLLCSPPPERRLWLPLELRCWLVLMAKEHERVLIAVKAGVVLWLRLL